MLALGAGALLASRAGSVIALLVRTAWNNAFSLLRNKTMKEHGPAIGYVTMFTGSAGFLLSSLLTPGGAFLGFLLLGGALAYAFSQWKDVSGLNSFLLLGFFLAIAALLLGHPEFALAHDGGWPEYMGNAPLTPGNILIYLQKGGSITALTRGLPPGAAAAVGAALAQALNALGQSAPDIGADTSTSSGSKPDTSSSSEPDTSDNSKIRDGDDARNWLIRNGYYDANGNPTKKLQNWWNLLPGSNVKTGLVGFATDDNGNVVIITDDGPPGSADAPTRSDSSSSADGGGTDGSGTDADAQGADSKQDGEQQDGDQQGDTQQDGDQQDNDQQDDDQSSEPDTHYNDPEWSQRNNPDPYNMDWDPDQQRWRPKDDLYAERMQRQGYGFDPDNDAWRKPPDAPDLEDVPDYSGTKYSTEWKPGLITYDVTTEGLDKHLDNLNRMERDALDAYRDLNDRIAEAEANGDTWLADQLRGNQDKVREHINDLQGQRTHIVNAVNDENTRVADYDRKIREPGLSGHTKQALQDGWDIACQIAKDPGMLTRDPDFTEKVRAGIQAAEQVRKGEGVELRPGLIGYDKVKTGPSIAEQFDDALKDVKDLNTQLEDARKRGDIDAVNRLTTELNVAKDEAQRLSGDLQQHVQNIKKWQVRSAQANLSIGRKGAEITAELAAVPSTAHAVTGLIDDFNRGQGIFHRNTIKMDGDAPDLDTGIPRTRPGTGAPPDVDLPSTPGGRTGTLGAGTHGAEVMDDGATPPGTGNRMSAAGGGGGEPPGDIDPPATPGSRTRTPGTGPQDVDDVPPSGGSSQSGSGSSSSSKDNITVLDDDQMPPDNMRYSGPARDPADFNQTATNPDHSSRYQGLGGEHANRDLEAPNTSDAPFTQRSYTTNNGKTIDDPYEASLARHSESKGGDTPWKSTTHTYERASRFNQNNVACIEMTDEEIFKLLQSKKAGRVPYSKMGNTQYWSEREFCFQKIPAENWKLVNSPPSPPAGKNILVQNEGPLAGYSYYWNDKGEKVFRFYRGLSTSDMAGM
jgi:hypothetical protein